MKDLYLRGDEMECNEAFSCCSHTPCEYSGQYVTIAKTVNTLYY